MTHLTIRVVRQELNVVILNSFLTLLLLTLIGTNNVHIISEVTYVRTTCNDQSEPCGKKANIVFPTIKMLMADTKQRKVSVTYGNSSHLNSRSSTGFILRLARTDSKESLNGWRLICSGCSVDAIHNLQQCFSNGRNRYRTIIIIVIIGDHLQSQSDRRDIAKHIACHSSMESCNTTMEIRLV